MAQQKSQLCLKLVALLGPFVMLCCLGLIAGANLQPLMTYGYGAEKNRVFVWWTCFAAIGDKAAECVSVNHPRMCSEMTSKLNFIGIMSAIAGFNILLTIISIIADIQACKCPVKNLTRIFFCWSIVPILLACAVAVMAMVNAQCGAATSLEDTEGKYGAGFQMLGVSFFASFLGLLVHTCVMHYLGNAQPTSEFDEEDEDEDDEAAEGKEMLEKKKKAPGKKAAGKKSAPRPNATAAASAAAGGGVKPRPNAKPGGKGRPSSPGGGRAPSPKKKPAAARYM